MGIKFALLASGSKGNCCVIKNNESSIVIDCGSTKTYLTKSFSRIHYDYLNSDALFITHTHSDHISQLKMFDQVKTYAKKELETNHFHKIEAFDEIQVNTLKVKEIPLSHDSDFSSGFIIESDGKKLVYVTDTGYVKEEYFPYLENADYYIFESNHDVEMLMNTRRPMFVKQRILGDQGHLCNEDSAEILAQLIGENTKEIVLAHISEEGNDRCRAEEILKNTLVRKNVNMENVKIVAAPQFDIIIGGE